jgi:hypothetical protein
MELSEFTRLLGLRQRVLEKLLATLVLWCALLSAASTWLAWLWLTEVPAHAARQSIATLWGQASGIAACLGFAGCVVALGVAWWLVDTILQRWMHESTMAMRK